MSSFNWPASGSGGGINVYTNLASFPPGSFVGDAAIDASNIGNLYEWNGSSWVLTATSGNVVLGNLTDAGTDGIVITGGTNAVVGSGTSIAQHVADTTHNGYLSSTDWNTFNNKQSALTLTNLTDAGTDGITITNGTGAVIGASPVTVSQHVADTTHNGYLSSTDWNTFNNKQSALTFGNLTDAGTDGITVTGGTGAVIGSGTSIAQRVADTTHNGYLSSTDWNTFNNKQSALTFGNLTDAGTDGIVVTGGTGAIIGSGVSLAQHVADATHNGYLSSTDWNTFNNKQATVSFGAFGSTPNSSGGGISAGVITLQPADGSNPGGVSTSSQTFAGTKTFANIIDSGLTASQAVVTDGSKQLTSLPYATAPAASTLAEWDANKNLSANNHLAGYATTATAAGTTTLTVSSAQQQYFTGTSTQTVVLPVTSTLVTGQSFAIINNSTGIVTVQSSGNNTLQAMAASTELIATCISTSGTGTASWSWVYLPLSQSTLAVQPTIQRFTSGTAQTYTTPAGVQWIKVKMSGGGGGGGGNAAGNDGSATTFGTSLLTANGGTKGAASGSNAGGAGGTATVGAGATQVIANTGGTGFGGISAVTASQSAGGAGGQNALGGAAPSTAAGKVDGGGAIANTGGGGAGGGGNTSAASASGGGAGGYLEAIIFPTSGQTFTYTVGSGGNGSASGTNVGAGGNGAAGVIIVEEYYYNLAITSQITAVSPTVQKFTSSSGTYTTPAGVQYIRVRMVGGGGGGAGSAGNTSGSSAQNGGTGGNTTFGTSLLTANGGQGGQFASANSTTGGTGGSATISAPAYGTGMTGNAGSAHPVYNALSNSIDSFGGLGGVGFFGGGSASANSGSGSAGIANSGSGGAGGGGIGGNLGQTPGSGGGAGAFIDAIIPSPSATYSYAVGAAGTAGAAGTNGVAGVAGGSGYIEVTEYYTNLAVGTTAAITANYVMAGPPSGAAANPGFRALVSADMPAAICARFYNSALNHSIGTSFTTLIGDTTMYSNGITVSAGTGLFTILTAGKYRFTANCSTNTAGTSGSDVISWGVVKNGSAVTGYGGAWLGIALTGQQVGAVVTDTINLAVNDTFGVQFKQNAHSFTANLAESVTIEWIGP